MESREKEKKREKTGWEVEMKWALVSNLHVLLDPQSPIQ